MKKIVFTTLVAVFVLVASTVTLAQDKDAAQKEERRKELQEKVQRVSPPDASELRRKAKIDELRRKDRGREQREKRRQELMKKIREREKTKAGRDIGQPGAKGKDFQRQLGVLKKQMTREDAKNLKRMARLRRIRQLADTENNTKIIERVDKLIRKEQMRYNRKREKMRGRMRMFTRMQAFERGGPQPGKKGLDPEARKALRDRPPRPKPNIKEKKAPEEATK
ncbi:MAG: hypothetical protein ACYTEL_04275 [Planctomycetota bacterium]|jgi:hypothetical protein